jgi:hypothetical protein
MQDRIVYEAIGSLPKNIWKLSVYSLSGAENFLESQVEKTVTRENSILVSNRARFFKEAVADGGLFRGKAMSGGIGRC